VYEIAQRKKEEIPTQGKGLITHEKIIHKIFGETKWQAC
jgi:hypothetical protein